MKKQTFWVIISGIIMLGFFLGGGVCDAALASASQYKSMYSDGYRDTYNPANWGGSPPASLHLGTSAPGARFFRYYIPPAVSGTVTLALFVPQTQMIGAVARLGFPPQCSQYTTQSPPESEFYDLPWDEYGNLTLAQLRERDCCVRNYTGTISLVKDHNSTSTGEWLYVMVIFDGTSASHVSMTNFEVGINGDLYVSWYNSATWDNYGDPLPNGMTPTTGTCNNFIPSGSGSTPTPTPGGEDPFEPGLPGFTPTPTPTPGSGGYTITVNKDGNGTITPAGPVTVQSGGSQAFTFAPASGYIISDVIIDPWGNNPQHKGAITSYTFTNVMSDHQLSVIFTKTGAAVDYYTITVSKQGSGTVYPAGPVEVESGASQTFTFTPVSCHVVSDVIIDSSEHKGCITSYTFTNVTSDHALSVIFEEEEEDEETYTASDLWPAHIFHLQCNGSSIDFTPTLSFAEPPADSVDCFACYVKDGKLYVAQLGLDGEIFFERYIIGDELLSYGTYNFSGDGLWECKAFQGVSLIDSMLDQAGIVFYCAVCANGDLRTLQGASFEYKCSK